MSFLFSRRAARAAAALEMDHDDNSLKLPRPPPSPISEGIESQGGTPRLEPSGDAMALALSFQSHEDSEAGHFDSELDALRRRLHEATAAMDSQVGLCRPLDSLQTLRVATARHDNSNGHVALHRR